MESLETSVHSPEEILVFQSVTGGISLCESALQMVHLERKRDFLVFPNLIGLKETVMEDRPQLFITSSWVGEMRPIIELVEEFRKKNPQLVAVLFDVGGENSPVFERKICSWHDDDWPEKLVAAVIDFRYGILRRKAAPTAS